MAVSWKRIHPLLLGLVVTFIIIKIVALTPSTLEQADAYTPLDPKSLLVDNQETLAAGIPQEKIPDYSVDQFNYVSTQAGQRQWKLLAEKAFLFHKEKLVHARSIHAFLYDPEGKITLVTGKEAKYYVNQRDLEVFGAVKTKFPDGFETESEYLRYYPNRRKIEIPIQYPVKGFGNESDGQKLSFESRGLDFSMADAKIILPNSVRVTLERKTLTTPDITQIQSDHCVIYRSRQLAYFTMSPSRPLTERFVIITQPTLYARSRRAEMNYGDFSKILQYLIAYEDVMVKEVGKGASLRYGTGGRADFDTHRDVIVLKEFPQVYQDNDTVTGDIIVLHRDTDIIEVEHSNAFSQGEQQ